MASPPPMLSVETTPAPSNEVPLQTPRLVRRSQSLQGNRLALLLPHDSTMASTAFPGRPMAPRRVRSSILPSAAEEDSMLADAVNNNSTALLDSTNIPLIPSLDSPRLNGATRLTLKRRDGRASLLDDYDTKSNDDGDDGFDLEIASLSLPHHSRTFPTTTTTNMLRTPVNATSTPPLVRFGMQAPSPVTMVQLPPPPANVMLPSPSALMTLPAKLPFFERSASEGTPAIVSRPRALLFPRPKTSWICERLAHRREEDDMIMFKENKKPRFNSV